MNILFLGYDENQTLIINFLKEKGYKVTTWKEKIDLHFCKKYDFFISFGYKHLLKKDILEWGKNKFVNLHMSYLPYNRGSSPNYWSFQEKTPSGVTIHLIDEGIDTGDILIQKQITFKPNENTLRTSYERLKYEIEILFIENYKKIINGDISPSPQPKNGTIHFDSELPPNINWDKKLPL